MPGFKNSFAENICGKCGATHSRKHYWCRDCNNQYARANRDKLNRNARARSKNPKDRLKSLLSASTVDRSLLDFDKLYKRLEEGGFRCEITGIPFSYEPRDPKAISIDRIDPNLPYSVDNIRIVCWWVNAAMGNWGLDKLRAMVDEWRINEEQ